MPTLPGDVRQVENDNAKKRAAAAKKKKTTPGSKYVPESWRKKVQELEELLERQAKRNIPGYEQAAPHLPGEGETADEAIKRAEKELLPKLGGLLSLRTVYIVAGAVLVIFVLVRLTATSPTVQTVASAVGPGKLLKGAR